MCRLLGFCTIRSFAFWEHNGQPQHKVISDYREFFNFPKAFKIDNARRVELSGFILAFSIHRVHLSMWRFLQLTHNLHPKLVFGKLLISNTQTVWRGNTLCKTDSPSSPTRTSPASLVARLASAGFQSPEVKENQKSPWVAFSRGCMEGCHLNTSGALI